jgi:hypothetical protein
LDFQSSLRGGTMKVALVFCILTFSSIGCSEKDNHDSLDTVDIYSEICTTLEECDDLITRWNCRKAVECCNIYPLVHQVRNLSGPYDNFDDCYAAEAGLYAQWARDATTFLVNVDILKQLWDFKVAYYPEEGCYMSLETDAYYFHKELGNQLYEGLGIEGDACSEDFECIDSLYCDYSPKVCTPRLGDGESCNTNTECLTGFTCMAWTSGVCEMNQEVGDPCNWQEIITCPNKNFSLTCSPDTGTCVTKFGDGKSCSLNWNCSSGFCNNDGICEGDEHPFWYDEGWMCEEVSEH